MADAYKGIPGLSKLDREILRSYAGSGEATPLEVRHDAAHTKERAAEISQLTSDHRKMLLKGYVSLAVILTVGGFIIWQAFAWSATLAQGSLLDPLKESSLGTFQELGAPD